MPDNDYSHQTAIDRVPEVRNMSMTHEMPQFLCDENISLGVDVADLVGVEVAANPSPSRPDAILTTYEASMVENVIEPEERQSTCDIPRDTSIVADDTTNLNMDTPGPLLQNSIMVDDEAPLEFMITH